jgi:hypothetical protein
MVNYSNGKIYKIQKMGGNAEIYIGSTTKQYLSQRLEKHRSDYKRFKSGKIIKNISSFDIFEKYGVENCEIVLIESVQCDTKDELLQHERRHIEANECVNKVIPIRTKDEKIEIGKQYYEDNKEVIKEKKKVYRENNKDKIKAYKTQKCICDCGVEYQHDHKSRHLKSKIHQQFVTDGIDRTKLTNTEKKKIYRENNKDKIKAHKTQKCICECGSEFQHDHKARHLRSKIHQNFLTKK